MSKSVKLDQLELMALPLGHGGKRRGAGRKPAKERSVVMRVPASCVVTVTNVINHVKSGGGIECVLIL